MKRAYGFTIVELLIVIVVIAILAALSYVGYTSMSNRSHDSVVNADLANAAKQLQLYYAEKGIYPLAGLAESSESGPISGSVVGTPGMPFKVTSSSYHEPTGAGAANFVYCSGPLLDGGDPAFGIVAQSKSLSRYRYRSGVGIESGSWPMGPTSACSGIGYPRSYSYGYFTNSGGWQPWTK